MAKLLSKKNVKCIFCVVCLLCVLYLGYTFLKPVLFEGLDMKISVVNGKVNISDLCKAYNDKDVDEMEDSPATGPVIDS